SSRFSLFGRYNFAPAESSTRGGAGGFALSARNPFRMRTQTLTVGTLLNLNSAAYNDFHFNYSKNSSTQSFELDNFGGGVVPPNPWLFVSYPTPGTGDLSFSPMGGVNLILGSVVNDEQQQLNLIDALSAVKSTHQLKFGVDYRRLFPSLTPRNYVQSV